MRPEIVCTSKSQGVRLRVPFVKYMTHPPPPGHPLRPAIHNKLGHQSNFGSLPPDGATQGRVHGRARTSTGPRVQCPRRAQSGKLPPESSRTAAVKIAHFVVVWPVAPSPAAALCWPGRPLANEPSPPAPSGRPFRTRDAQTQPHGRTIFLEGFWLPRFAGKRHEVVLQPRVCRDVRVAT